MLAVNHPRTYDIVYVNFSVIKHSRILSLSKYYTTALPSHRRNLKLVTHHDRELTVTWITQRSWPTYICHENPSDGPSIIHALAHTGSTASDSGETGHTSIWRWGVPHTWPTLIIRLAVYTQRLCVSLICLLNMYRPCVHSQTGYLKTLRFS